MFRRIKEGFKKFTESIREKRSVKVNTDLVDINENEDYEVIFNNEPHLGNESIYIMPLNTVSPKCSLLQKETKEKRNRRIYWKKKKTQRKRKGDWLK